VKAKVTPEQVEEVRRRCAAGETHLQVAASFGVHSTTVQRILSGERTGMARVYSAKEPLSPASLARLRRAWVEEVELSREDIARRWQLALNQVQKLCAGLPRARKVTVTGKRKSA
jgi:plasmid maintenance system antidote protein VapI